MGPWQVPSLPLLLALLLGLPRAGAAGQRAGVRLELGDCIAAQAEVRRLFAIELDVEILVGEAPGAAQVRALCSETPGGPVELRVDDALTGKSLRRGIDLLAAPLRARPRLLALALAELLFASWTELEVPLRPDASAQPGTAPTVPPAPGRLAPGSALAPPTVASATAARLVVRRRLPVLAAPSGVRVLAAAAGLGLPQAGGVLAGAALRLGGDHRHHLGWALDATYLRASGESSLGTLTADALTGGAAMLYQHAIPLRGMTLRLRAGGGLRAGAARLAGVPANGAQARSGAFWGPMVGPTGVLSAGLALPRRLALDLLVEGGYLLTPLYGRVGPARALSIEGPWLGLQLGIGVAP